MVTRILFLLYVIVIFSCSPENEEEQLVYLSVRNKDYNIFLNNLKGEERQLTTNPGFDYAPMWNQKLNAIIYYSYIKDSFAIANMDLSGNPLPLETYGQQEFNLSPDGNKLVSQINLDDFSVLVLTSVDGTLMDTISDSNSYNGRAKWSWQSNKIAYISDRDGNNEIYIYDLEKQQQIRTTNNETFEKYLTWSPEGDKLAFTTQYYEEGKPDRNDVFVLEVETGISTQITNNPFNDSELAWSPYSDRIAFHSTRNGQDHIFIMNSDGSNITQVTKTDAYHGEPCWIYK